jgi:hypothetical protein
LKLKDNIIDRWNSFAGTAAARRLSVWLRRVLMLGILGVIAWNLYDIGPIEVLRSLPTKPIFYVLFVIIYLTLPLTEILIYGQVWNFRKRDGFRAFLTKKVYNSEVVDYSGEFYLYLWAKKGMNLKGKAVLKNIRDVNIMSVLVSYTMALSLVGYLIYTDALDLSGWFGGVQGFHVVGGVLVVILLGALLVQFRRYFFALPRIIAMKVFGLYSTRFLVHHGLLVLQWMVVIQGAPLSIWLTYLAVFIVVNRLPFLPSKDLLFAWAGIELSRYLGVGVAEVAGMLLVYSALNKVTNFTLFTLFSYFGKDPRYDPGPDDLSNGADDEDSDDVAYEGVRRTDTRDTAGFGSEVKISS